MTRAVEARHARLPQRKKRGKGKAGRREGGEGRECGRDELELIEEQGSESLRVEKGSEDALAILEIVVDNIDENVGLKDVF